MRAAALRAAALRTGDSAASARRVHETSPSSRTPLVRSRTPSVRRVAHAATLSSAALVAALSLPAAAQSPSAVRAAVRAERVDSAAIARIEDEGFNRSQVMNVTSWLTDVYGPRLTGGPTIRAAADWAIKTMTGWGLSNVKLEPWGPFGRGWSNEGFSLQVLAPQRWQAIAYPSAWTPGTNGPLTATAMLVRVDSEPDLGRLGDVRGKFVLLGAPRDLPPRFTPQASRYTEAQLDSIAARPVPNGGPNAGRGGRGGFGGPVAPPRGRCAQPQLQARAICVLADQGAAAVLLQGQGDDGTVFVSSTGGSRDTAPNAPLLPVAVLAAEHYGRLARTLAKGLPVTIELNAQNRWYDADRNAYNVTAEIPGSDARLKDEVVMVGAHFDSWHAGTGATDNAAGSAVMMEAMRILEASRVPLRRTVRIGLWTGEEEGLLGSRAYVRQHFGDTASRSPEHARFSAYFNVDNGTGKIRGVYQQGNAAVGPIFDAWMAPFKSRGMHTLTLANTTGTDHLSFDAVGLPGFQFIQDPVEYGTRTHHSNMDLYERIQPDDMQWNAVVVASFVMQAANRDEKVPRKGATQP